jgi:hypothetical protein
MLNSLSPNIETIQRRFSALALTLLLSAPFAVAQLSSTGTIAGTVADSSRAGIADASVVALNQQTKLAVTSRSNSDGTFALAGLQPGPYTVTIERSGFERYVVTDVQVHPALVSNVEAVLVIGSISTQVSVTATATEVQTATPEVSSQVSQQQVATLPLNGRNYQALAALIPGAANTSPDTALGQGGFSTSNVMSVNGMGLSGTFYTVDGIWNENTGNMTQTSVTPNPDTIQEVRFLQNNYSAQYSLMGANVVLVQTRSGTSQFHGSAYEYFRNNDLNARNFFSPTVPVLKQNIFGYTIGGPFLIPRLYNTARQKTFFFLSQQWSPQHIASVIRGQDPTAQQRGGDFSASSAAIIDPTTNKAFAGNIIPATRLNAQSLALLNAAVPLPNNSSGGALNYLNSTPQINSQRNDQIKVDQYFGEKFRVTGEFIGEHATQVYPNNVYLSSPYTTNQEKVVWPDYLAQIQLTTTISSSMVNIVSIAENHRVVSLTQNGVTLLSEVPGFNQVLPYSNGLGSDRLPQITFSGGWSPFGASSSLPLIGNSNLDGTISDDWSWLHGNTYLQAGINIYHGLKRQTNAAASNGSWSFTGQFTGNAIADYLLGTAATLSQASTETRPYMFYPMVSPYVQDRWKVTRRLTISAGLRFFWEPVPHTEQAYDTIFNPATFNPSQVPIVNANGSITPTANYNATNGLIFNGVNGVPLNFTDRHQFFLAPTAGFAWDVLGDGKTSLRGGYGITYTRVPTGYDCSYACSNNVPRVQSITLVNPSFPNSVGATVKPSGAPTLTSQDSNLLPGQIQSYSLSLEHQFAGNWFVSVAGAGNIARHLSATVNWNQPMRDGVFDYNPLINGGTVYTYQYGPYLGYGPINTRTSEGNAYWDALEINVRHPVGHNLFLTAVYTWQHDLADIDGTSLFGGSATVQNAYNFAANYGNTQVNIPQALSISAIWNLPWFQNAGGFKKAALGGWQFSDITTVQSGFSLDPGLSVSKQGLATRPNATGLSVNGPQTVAQWFNTAAFSAPAAGHFGNASPGVILGPGTVNFDMALYKTFYIKEQHNIEFRSEFFNSVNHTNFAAVSTSLGTATYGQVTSARDPRIIELVLRYQF